VFDGDILSAAGRPANLDGDLAALGGEFQGIREKVEDHLADGLLVRPDLRQAELELLVDRDALGAGAQLHHANAVLGNVEQGQGVLAELVAPRLDAGKVEDLVDEVKAMLARDRKSTR